MEKLLLRREKRILEMLTDAGYQAYFVGGAVRDALLGGQSRGKNGRDGQEPPWQAAPHDGDADVATDALPQQVKEVFSKWQVIETGIRHGTVTVVMPPEEGMPEEPTEPCAESKPVPVEITTCRTDGTYTDSRHPDDVHFVGSLTEDLARRDFTVNAMACGLSGNIIDPFGGREDLQRRCIRAVGSPDKRFREDALRIMRALRFSAVLGFDIEQETAAALFRNRQLLDKIAAERIFAELKKLVTGSNAGDVIRKYVDVLGTVIPELSAMKGFLQHNPYHKYDVLEHCIRAMETVETTPQNQVYMRFAALFHDIGKPHVFTMDEAGVGHFYGHPAKSEELTRGVLKRLKADNFTLERTALLVKRHDLLFRKDESLLKKQMNRLTPEVLMELLKLKWADNIATGNMGEELAERFRDIEALMLDVLRQKQCFSLKELAVNGRDLIEAGIGQGPEIGRTLDELLEAVMEGRCANEKDALLALVKRQG